MSDLNARLIAKASATAGEAPQAADLETAELAVNTADAKLFTKHSDGTVVELGGPAITGAKLEDLSDVGTPADDYILIYDTATTSWVPEPIAPVATTNDYNDLSNTPAFAAVATSGFVNDLVDTDLSLAAEGDRLTYDSLLLTWVPSPEPVDGSGHDLPQVFGLAAHASFDASAGGSFDFATDTIASGNVSGITRTATGKFTITFTNAFASNAYTAVCTAGDEDYSGSGASPRCVNVVSRSAGSMDIVVERSDDAVQDDEGYIAVMVIGLLA